MSEEAKMYACSCCGKPTPNYREYSHPMAGILGESGYSICDECLRQARIEREWENEQCAEERLSWRRTTVLVVVDARGIHSDSVGDLLLGDALASTKLAKACGHLFLAKRH